MTMNTEQVIWAKGRKQSEVNKYTVWSSPSPHCRLGGFSMSAWGSESVAVVPHSSDGECYSRFFEIPVDKVEEFCHSLLKVKKKMETNND